jgi:hypothetical protein
MTSGTTVLGIFPLALKQGTELELWPPFAITVLGGLAVSTVSTLVFIPVLYVGLEQTREWMKKIGWLWLTIGTSAATAWIYYFHQTYQSKLYTCLVALPIWFGILGMIYAVQQFFAVRREKARLAEETLRIRIKNLTKIYGLPGRFMREWNKQQRRLAEQVANLALPWNKENIRESAIWMTALGAMLIYLHTFFTNSIWLTLLSLLTLAWLFGVRELYYRWRFVNGKPPQNRMKKRSWKFWSKKKNSSEALE